MKAIKVSFRAIFKQPIWILNPMGCKMHGSIPVEIFGTGNRWQVRDLISRRVYEKIGSGPGPDCMKQLLRDCFAEQLEPWQMWANIPEGDSATGRVCERMVGPEEVYDLGQGRFALYGPEDRTHIAPPGFYSEKGIKASCGATISGKLIVSTKANVTPTCPQCAVIYQQEYASK